MVSILLLEYASLFHWH